MEKKLDSKKCFDDYYELLSKTEEKNTVSESLIDFLDTIVAPRFYKKSEEMNILDVGSGHKSIFERKKFIFKKITAIDFSSVAIREANKRKGKICYEEADFSDEKIFSEEVFDLIFDSHCLHSIIDTSDRKKVFFNIKRLLGENGLYACEHMVQPIYKKINMPMKYVPSAHEFEKEILEYGLKIVYFMIEPNKIFDNNGHKCDLLRMLAKN